MCGNRSLFNAIFDIRFDPVLDSWTYFRLTDDHCDVCTATVGFKSRINRRVCSTDYHYILPGIFVRFIIKIGRASRRERVRIMTVDGAVGRQGGPKHGEEGKTTKEEASNVKTET